MIVSRTRQLLPWIALGLVSLLSACSERHHETDARFGSANSERLAAKATLVAPTGAELGEVELHQLLTAHSREVALTEVTAYVRAHDLDPAKAYTVRIHDGASCAALGAAFGPAANDRVLRGDAAGHASAIASLARLSLEEGQAQNVVGKAIALHDGGEVAACGVVARVAAVEEHGHGGHGEAAGEHGGHEAAPAAEGGHGAAPAEGGHEGHAH